MDFKCTGRLPHISNNYLYDILLERGIDNPSDYLNVDKTSITPFDTLDNIIEAGNKLIEVINNVDNPNILITVDSDVDGYTSAAIMYSYLKQSIKKEISLHYLIHDGKQHGIDDLLEQIKDLLPDILIIPDASSSELEEHKIISKICPIIVLDHHQSDVVNDEYAIRVNNQLSENFSNKTLCGAGIVYKFCQCLDSLLNINNADNYLDLVAVALVADMMDLRNPETHYLVKTGLKNINNSGLKAFVNAMGYSLGGRTELVPVDVAFYIAPYINAIIRVGTQDIKKCVFEALIDGDRIVQSTKRGAKAGEIEILGEQAARVAKNAKALQQRLVDKAMDALEAKIFKYDLLENKIILIPVNEEDDIHPSLTGLIAMKIAAKYHHPTLILRECDDGVLKGSIRDEGNTAMGGFKEYLEDTDMFEYVQGHSSAAGAGISECKIDDFIKFSNEQLKDVDFNSKAYPVDYIFNYNEDFTELIFDIDKGKEIWGQGVAEPTIAVKDIVLSKDDIVIMKNNCMKFNYNGISYVIFKNEQAINDFTEHDKFYVTVYGKGNVNEWCGKLTPQFLINAYSISKAGKYIF